MYQLATPANNNIDEQLVRANSNISGTPSGLSAIKVNVDSQSLPVASSL